MGIHRPKPRERGDDMERKLLYLVVFSVLLGACGTSESELATALAQTLAAQPSNTPTPADTSTPTETAIPPTSTPIPTSTPLPSATPLPRPISLSDDFSQDNLSWLICDYCDRKNNAFYMGPWPASGAYIQHFALCEECGLITNYRVSVDATFEDGESERGYGFVLRLTDEYLITAEITPWQTVDVWKLDFIEGWDWVNGVWTGAVKAGRQTNHIEVEVSEGATGKSDISVTVNGKTVLVVWGQPLDQGPVGLTLWGHALEVSFDNFEFEEFEPYGEPFDTGPLDFDEG